MPTITNHNILPGVGQRVHFRQVVIPHAEVLTLSASPYVLVPAPGEGKVIHLIFVNIAKPSGTTPYGGTGTPILSVRYTDASGERVTGFRASDFRSSGGRTRLAYPYTEEIGGANSSYINIVPNAPLVLLPEGSNEFTNGDVSQPFHVSIMYDIVEV